MENQKILIAIPYHPAKDYCIKTCLKRANELTYQNKEIVMRFDPGEYGGENNVKKQREFFRRLAIREDYDYLYFFGVDTIPPKDVLERLLPVLEENEDVGAVGGVYWGRHEAENGKPEGAVAWIHGKSEAEQNKIFSTMNALIPVNGMGMDCVLFPRRVFERISWLDWEQNDDDYPYYDRIREANMRVLIDTNIQCKHYFNKKGYTYLGKTIK